MRKINKIIVHCSDSHCGTAEEIDRWHKQRGWKGIGYHFVICNGYPWPSRAYIKGWDGIVQDGRPVEQIGAHCRGHNQDSIGICLIGKRCFTGQQLFIALPFLLARLLREYNLTPDDVYGHQDFNQQKTCPNIDTGILRRIANMGR